ncbi:MAG: CDP-diacylglycerol--glycerol-3-phosphate 3-phosphatidyltransferase [Eubacterium sp.]|nr:CDP-diacylglycerol--glycerol-3-phosphate 3-phosphatidyltransferase [Eubacterium sp.]MCM1418429.1 CDP-diacylglycerol--glycerol-3-phosphate 3-phosphatidyltransferase [Roseburia sp.]
MNLANKLTLFRVALVPFFVAALGSSWHLIALILFAVASVTDMLDGRIARKYNQITDFGKFLDPLADKILVAAALIGMVERGYTWAWLVWVVIAREFLVSGVRLVAAGSPQKLVIAANIWGKLKTASTMVAICVVLFLHALVDFGVDVPLLQPISNVLMILCAVLTVISGITYLWDYRGIWRSAGEE